MKNDLYAEITAQMVDALRAGTKPWVRPWSVHGPGLPYNQSTQKTYSGINVFLLACQAIGQGYSSDAWLTFKQAQILGGSVKKGEKGTRCVFFKTIEKTGRNDQGEDETTRFPVINGFTVFNLDQIDGIEPEVPPVREWEPIASAESLWSSFDCQTVHGGNRACYVPSLDRIHMPQREQFAKAEDYYCTLLHEMGHATGHKSRLDRPLVARYGTDAYAFEELVAEFTSWFLCAETGLQGELQHQSYIQSWIRVLKFDKRALFKAAAQAQKARDYIVQCAQEKAEQAAA